MILDRSLLRSLGVFAKIERGALLRSAGICMLVFLVACSSDEQVANGPGGGPGGPGSGSVPSVEVVQAQLGSLPLEERLVGIVMADNQVEIYPEITAPVIEVHVQSGDVVSKGQALVSLEARQFQEQLNQAQASLRINEADSRQAEARLRELKLQFERTESLAEKELVSELELETQRAQVDAAAASYERTMAQVEQANATIQERRAALARTVIRAPISGRIGQRNVEVGMRVSGNTQIFTIGNLDNVRVEASLTESMLNYIKEGQNARISSELMSDSAIVMPVSRISPFLEAGSFSTTAEIDVPNPGGVLKPGMFVTVDVFYGESQQATVIPNSALYEDPSSGALGVFVATSLGLETPAFEPESDEETAPYTEPTPVKFFEVDVIAPGHDLSGISGIDDNAWVVTLGQQLLNGTSPQARVRATTWNRLISLQNLQREDLLKQFLEKQQRLAKTGKIMGDVLQKRDSSQSSGFTEAG